MGDGCSGVDYTYTALLLCLLHWFRVRLVPRHLRTTFQSSYQPRNKAWQVSVSTSASRSSMCASFFPSFFFPTDGPEPSPSRSQAHIPRFHMHPLLSYTWLHHAPISYNIAFTPSARTVVDRTVHPPLSAVTLHSRRRSHRSQPARVSSCAHRSYPGLSRSDRSDRHRRSS